MIETHNMSWMWLLLIIATTFSLLNLYLFYKLLKKLDDNMLVVSEAIEVFTEQLSKVLKDVEVLKRNVRIVNNEVKEKRHRDKAKDQRIV
jgi:uncharacterized protein YoxC